MLQGVEAFREGSALFLPPLLVKDNGGPGQMPIIPRIEGVCFQGMPDLIPELIEDSYGENRPDRERQRHPGLGVNQS